MSKPKLKVLLRFMGTLSKIMDYDVYDEIMSNDVGRLVQFLEHRYTEIAKW